MIELKGYPETSYRSLNITVTTQNSYNISFMVAKP